jgi:hypothetical protein
MISLDKKYKTKSGQEVRIYSIDGGGEYPVHGAFLAPGGYFTSAAWTEEGLYSRAALNSLFNLEEISPLIDTISVNKKYRTRDGREVRIYATDGSLDSQIHGAILYQEGWSSVTWNKSGSFYSYDRDSDLIEVTPYDDLQIDDKVLVWNDRKGTLAKFKRYFAGVSRNGKPLAFSDGATSWSTEDTGKRTNYDDIEFYEIGVEWDNCEKYTGENL